MRTLSAIEHTRAMASVSRISPTTLSASSSLSSKWTSSSLTRSSALPALAARRRSAPPLIISGAAAGELKVSPALGGRRAGSDRSIRHEDWALLARASSSVVNSRTGSSKLSAAEKSAGAVTAEEETTTMGSGSEIVPAVIVGGGRVGQALEKMGGGKDTVVRRGETIPADSQGPIIVCTRNDALAGIIDATPASRREDLVFIQNGMLEPLLESKGLGNATIVLVYFAVAKAGDLPTDGKTDLNPEGLTASAGKWASAIAARLHSVGLSCKVLDQEEFKKPLLEKLIWIAAFMLVGARHPGATVGVVEKEHRDEVVSLINELRAAAEVEKQLKFPPGLEDRLCSYARSVAHFPTAVKEFEWRNGWFYGITENAIAKGESDPLPLHTAWLKEVGAIEN